MKPEKTSSSFFIAITIIFLMFSAIMIAQAGWFESVPYNPTANNVVAPLRTDSSGQAKGGAIELNTSLTNQRGLIVAGDNGTGKVGIGNTVPPEKLSIFGNFQFNYDPGNAAIQGSIRLRKPNNTIDFGKSDEILSSEGSYMDWAQNFAWMSIQRIDIRTSSGCISFFPECPIDPFGDDWQEYKIQTFTSSCTVPVNKGWSYGNQIRICYKPLR